MMRNYFKNLIVTAIVFGGLFSLGMAPLASASSFNAGRIIDDVVFTDKSTMSASQIQDFLNAKMPRCDTWGEQPYGNTTRAQYAASRGISTPFTCLKDYTQDGKRASQIIYDVAQKYSINPQVLIVLLQKEQGLITDDWPWPIQYRSATGYGCPDTADCSARYYGFTNQVDWAAKMFRAILNDSPDWYTPYELGNNFIQYSPNASCGGSTVNVQNRSTQALYNYTPYQPNQAALDAGWGEAPCGAYGNRNFHLYFTSWFGSTFVQFTPLSTQRWMQSYAVTQKKDPWTGNNLSGDFPVGTQLKFVDKILVNGSWFLRTEYDSVHNLLRGFPLVNFGEVSIEPLLTPRYMELNSARQKWNPATSIGDISTTFPSGTTLKFVDKMQLNGNWYYRTQYDSENNNRKFITATGIDELTYTAFETPRFMSMIKTAAKVDPATGLSDETQITSGSQLKFTEKVRVNESWYYRTQEDATSQTKLAILATNVQEIPYSAFGSVPKWMLLTQTSDRYKPSTGLIASDRPAIAANTQVLLSDKITVNGTAYFRSAFDKHYNYDSAVPAALYSEIQYAAMEAPRQMKLAKSTQKQNPKTGEFIGGTFPAGMVISFDSKIIVNGNLYLRSEYDSSHSLDSAIYMGKLSEVY